MKWNSLCDYFLSNKHKIIFISVTACRCPSSKAHRLTFISCFKIIVFSCKISCFPKHKCWPVIIFHRGQPICPSTRGSLNCHKMSSYSDTIFNALTLFGMIMMILASKGHSYIVPSILFLNYTTQFSLVQILLLYFESFVKKIIIRDCLKIFLTEKLLIKFLIYNKYICDL